MSEEKRPEWMSSISGIVNPDDYLLGRRIDKTFELSQQEKAERAREARLNLIASDKLKLVGDPILDLERRKHELKLEILSNPIKLKQFRERLLKEESKKQNQSGMLQDELSSKGQTSDQHKAVEKDRKQLDARKSKRRRSPSSTSSTSTRDSRSNRHRRRYKSSKHKRRISPTISRHYHTGKDNRQDSQKNLESSRHERDKARYAPDYSRSRRRGDKKR